MRLALDPRARRLLRRVPRNTVYTALELVLLSLLALQAARLVWTIVTPVGPVGDWRAGSALQPPRPSPALLAEFDPFFRLSGGNAPVVVTSLAIKLFGVREDRATGRGSAIIGTPDGEQRSFAVGDEIVPGVTLSAVGFDNVTITRNGAAEQLFLDQSPPAEMVAPEGTEAVAPVPGLVLPTPTPTRTTAAAAPRGSIATDVRFQPRMDGAEVTGVTVQPQGSGNAFRAAGLAPGDVILSVNGRRIRSADEAGALAGRLSGPREVPVQVERDGRVITLRVRPGQ
ncbi:MAG TPA: type II secretion system protein N [Allosphingosinicella sp.]|nr:type II secretion system protein N [Allosphingosinicella sp.]